MEYMQIIEVSHYCDCVGVTVNDTDISTGQRGPKKYPVNSKINLTITVNSIHCECTIMSSHYCHLYISPTASTLTNLLLMVQPYQDNSSGSQDINLHGKLVSSGSLRVKVPKVSCSFLCNTTV